MRKRPAKFPQHQIRKLITVIVDFPQTLMEFQFPPLLEGKHHKLSQVTSCLREETVSDFIAAFVAPPLQSPADLATVVSQQVFTLNAPIGSGAHVTVVATVSNASRIGKAFMK